MAEETHKILSPKEFFFLRGKDPEGVYDRDARESIYWLIEKLGTAGSKCSRAERKLYKKLVKARFGILIPKGTETVGTITHVGNVVIAGGFEGKVQVAGILTIEKTGVLKSNVTAETVICRGTVQGDIRAFDRVVISASGKVWGNIHTSSIHIEKGAIFEGLRSKIQIQRSENPLGLVDFLGFRKSKKIG